METPPSLSKYTQEKIFKKKLKKNLKDEEESPLSVAQQEGSKSRLGPRGTLVAVHPLKKKKEVFFGNKEDKVVVVVVVVVVRKKKVGRVPHFHSL